MSDLKKIQDILDYLDNELHPVVSPDNYHIYSDLHDMVESLLNESSEKADERMDSMQ